MKKLFISLLCALSLLSCTNKDNYLLGVWEIGNQVFKFSTTTVEIYTQGQHLTIWSYPYTYSNDILTIEYPGELWATTVTKINTRKCIIGNKTAIKHYN